MTITFKTTDECKGGFFRFGQFVPDQVILSKSGKAAYLDDRWVPVSVIYTEYDEQYGFTLCIAGWFCLKNGFRPVSQRPI